MKNQDSRSALIDCIYRCLPALALLLMLNEVGETLRAQTPWEAAPAKPAEMPQVGTNKVASLPPPPGASPAKSRSQSKTPLDSPQYVPLRSAMQAAQRTSVAAGGEGSLIPDTFAVPVSNSTSGLTVQSKPAVGVASGNFDSGNVDTESAAVGLRAPFKTSVFANLPIPDASELPLPSEVPTPGVSSPVANPPSASASAVFDAARGAQLVSAEASGASRANRDLVAFNNASSSTAPSAEFDAGKLVAVVGTDHILAGDMAVFVEPIIEKNKDRIRSKEEEDKLRMQLTRQVLAQYVEVKAMYQEFFHDMVGTAPPKEIETMKKQVVTKAGKIFFEKQVPNLLEKYEAKDLRELEEKLREKSMSLSTLRSQFIEQVLSQELERKYVPMNFEISRDELLRDYQKKKSEWNMPARAKWRQLTIRFDKHDGDRSVVETLIKNLGNQVYFGGNFEAVAKQASEGYTASEGGVYDWTTRGSLKSSVLDTAIFQLPMQRLSQVLEDDIGMHIIEVVEREAERIEDFTVAQAEIRKRLSDEKREEEGKKFRAKVLARTPIWSLWPEDLKDRASHARPLSDALGDDAN